MERGKRENVVKFLSDVINNFLLLSTIFKAPMWLYGWHNFHEAYIKVNYRYDWLLSTVLSEIECD